MRFACLVLLAVAAASAPSAQVRQDLVELGGSGTLQFSDGDAVLYLSPTLGYFVTNQIEVGLNPSIATDFDDGTVYLTAFGAYHFAASPTARTVPFVAALLGGSVTDGGGLALGAEAGVKQFFQPGGALVVNAFVTTDESFDAVVAGVEAGVSIFL